MYEIPTQHLVSHKTALLFFRLSILHPSKPFPSHVTCETQIHMTLGCGPSWQGVFGTSIQRLWMSGTRLAPMACVLKVLSNNYPYYLGENNCRAMKSWMEGLLFAQWAFILPVFLKLGSHTFKPCNQNTHRTQSQRESPRWWPAE